MQPHEWQEGVREMICGLMEAAASGESREFSNQELCMLFQIMTKSACMDTALIHTEELAPCVFSAADVAVCLYKARILTQEMVKQKEEELSDGPVEITPVN